MPDGRSGKHGGEPFSRATSSHKAMMVTCCASTLACKAALSECNRRASPTRQLTTSRNSASENLSSDAVSGNDLPVVNHSAALNTVTSLGNLLQLRDLTTSTIH